MNTDTKKIVTIMKENSLPAYFATCDGDQPKVRPVSPIIEDDMSIWVTTFKTSRKVKQLCENPRMCLAFVEHPEGDKAVTVTGRAEIVEDLEQKKKVWDLAAFDMAGFFPDGPESDNYCLLKILPDEIEWRESWTTGQQVYEP